MVANLTSSDKGPKSVTSASNWNKKVISVSTNKMNIQFKSDDSFEYKGFSADIHFTPISNEQCKSWLDMNKKIIKSPNYPQPYQMQKNCSWLITVDHDYYITLDFIEFYVCY